MSTEFEHASYRVIVELQLQGGSSHFWHLSEIGHKHRVIIPKSRTNLIPTKRRGIYQVDMPETLAIKKGILKC